MAASRAPVQVVPGNILDAKEMVICHQTNTKSRGQAAGVARLIFEKWPYADRYRDECTRRPGEVDICIGPADIAGYTAFLTDQVVSVPIRDKIIANLNGQIFPGKPRGAETAETRLRLFRSSIGKLGEWCHRTGIRQIAMPHGIGCGMAGGDWNAYHDAIRAFAERYGITVMLYQL